MCTAEGELLKIVRVVRGTCQFLNRVRCIACLISNALKTWAHADTRAAAGADGNMLTVTSGDTVKWSHLFAGLIEILSQQCFKCLAPAVFVLSVS